MNFGVFGGFVGSIDSGKAFDLSGASFFIKSFWVSLLANLDWGVNEHFHEIDIRSSFNNQLSDAVAVCTVWADEGGQSQCASRTEDFCDASDPPNVLFAILGRKSQPKTFGEFVTMNRRKDFWTGVESVPDIVAIKHETIGVQFV